MISIAVGAIIAGKYRLDRALAQGGMGSVWVAHHLQLDVTVAIKFMDPALAASRDARSRFEREAQAAAKLKSPHVVQVHDFGIVDDTPYIVMELLVGEDLEMRLERLGRMSPAALAPLVSQVAKALRRAHENGIVHRDLKPLNIFISRQDEDDVAKVLDFGIAKAPTSAIGGSTKTGTLIGSPHYMSPEQARGAKQLDHRSDLWSLGVILFRAVTGRLPFPGDDLGDVLVAICADPIPAASTVAPDVGPAIDRFFEKALQRDVEQRFGSARELAEAFAALAMPNGESWSAGPPSSGLAVPSFGVAPPGPPPVHPSSSHLVAPAPAPTASLPLPSFASRGIAVTAGVGGTLAPAGNSIVRAPPGGSRVGAAVAAIGAVAVALGVVWMAFLRAPAPASSASSPGVALATEPTGAASPTPVATGRGPAAEAPAPSASAAIEPANPAPSSSAAPRVPAPAKPLTGAPPTPRPAAPPRPTADPQLFGRD